MKQRDERSGSASPTGETDCKMNSLRRIVQGSYSSFFATYLGWTLETQVLSNENLAIETKIYLGEEIVEYSVLTRVERLMEERFGKDPKVDHPVDHWRRNNKIIIEKSDQPVDHFIPYAKKPVRVSVSTHLYISLYRQRVVNMSTTFSQA